MNRVSTSSIKNVQSYYKDQKMITHSGSRWHCPGRGCSIWHVRHPSISHLPMKKIKIIKCQIQRSKKQNKWWWKKKKSLREYLWLWMCLCATKSSTVHKTSSYVGHKDHLKAFNYFLIEHTSLGKVKRCYGRRMMMKF